MASDSVRINFFMPKSNLDKVDAACARLGINRTAFINFACVWFLNEEARFNTETSFDSFVAAARQMDDYGDMVPDSDA